MPAGGLVRRGALVAVLLGAAACAPAAHRITAAHPASSQAPVGPRVALPASEETAAAPAAPDAPGAHDHHEHHDHSAPDRKEAPAAPSPQAQPPSPPSPQPHQHTP